MTESDFPAEKLPRSFYEREPVVVAKDLLGCLLVRAFGNTVRAGRIVEVEAYLGPSDLASHASKGLTVRTAALFGPPGHAYVYLIYGIHCCMNVVTSRQGRVGAVLLRALEPVQNLAGRTSGPGLLCKAMGIDRSLNGHDLLSDDLFLCRGPKPLLEEIAIGPRIGVEYAGEWAEKELRFYIKNNSFVSRR